MTHIRKALPATLALLATTALVSPPILPSRKAPLICAAAGLHLGRLLYRRPDRLRLRHGPQPHLHAYRRPFQRRSRDARSATIRRARAVCSAALSSATTGRSASSSSVPKATSKFLGCAAPGRWPASTSSHRAFAAAVGAPIGSASYREDWRTSSRIRIGYSFGRVLVYAAGGGTYGSFRFNNTYNSQFNVITGASRRVRRAPRITKARAMARRSAAASNMRLPTTGSRAANIATPTSAPRSRASMARRFMCRNTASTITPSVPRSPTSSARAAV